MTVEQLIARARSVEGKGCKYKLGCGGLDPKSPHPWDKDSNSDCCLAVDTMIQTVGRGLIPVQEILPGDHVVSRTDAGSISAPSVLAVLPKGIQQTLRIKCSGNSIYATANHPLLIIKNSYRDRMTDGTFGGRHHEMSWEKAGNLEPGDTLVRTSTRPRPLNPINLPEDLGFLIGVFLGDGSIHRSKGLAICVYGKTADRVQGILLDLFGIKSSTTKSNGVICTCEPLRLLLEVSGLAVESYLKRVPEWVWNTSDGFIRAFISGCIASDGHSAWYKPHTAWSFSSCNEVMLRQVRDLCRLVRYRVADVQKIERTKPIVIKGKLVKIAKPLFSFEIYPYSRRTGQSMYKPKSRSLGPDFLVDPVLSVSEHTSSETYDLAVDQPNNFTANDLIVHNSAYTAWCMGVSKFVTGFPWYDEQHNGKWLNTDAVVRDAKSPFGFMDLIALPRPGCLAVYPKLSAKGYGHIGLVTEGNTLEKCRIIHCSSGNYSKTGDAIRETDSSVFRRAETIFVWCAFVNGS